MIPSQKKWIALGIENLGRGRAEPPPFLLAKLTLSSRFSPQPIQTSKKRNTSKKTYCFYSIPVPKMCSSHFSLDRRPPAAEFPSAGFSLSSASGAYAAPSVSAVFGRIFLCRKSPQSPPFSLSAFSFARRRSLPAPFLSLLSLFLLSLIIYRFRLKALLLIEIYK